MNEDLQQLKDEYDDDLEFMHARYLHEIGNAACRSLSGNVGFVAKQHARHHVLKGLIKKGG